MAALAGRRAPARAVVAALGCYLMWGLLAIYWKQLQDIDAQELIAQRVVWSSVFLAGLLAWRGGFGEVIQALSAWRSVGLHFLSSALLTINWLVFVWAVNAGHLIESSLGYFLLPLLNVALGRFFLRESLNRTQALAVAFAAAGVGLQLWQLGRLPWIALSLAVTFGLYGLLRKQSPLGSLTGLAVETVLMAPFAGAYLLWQHHLGNGALGRVDAVTHVLMLSAGVITAVPLLLFAYGARQLRLTTLGVLQYVAPICQFLIGLLVYREPFSRTRLAAFGLIWIGLLIYTLDGLRSQRQLAPPS